MQLNYTSVPTFARIHQDPNKYIFCMGPVGSGKSSGCIWHILLNGMCQVPQWDGVRRSRYGILRATYPALKSTVVKSWQNWFKDLVTITYDVPIRGSIKIPHPDGQTLVEIELIFIALDREEDVNKLQSLELTGAHLNECAEIPRAVHQMMKSRINRYPDMASGAPINPFIVADYNAVSTNHWLYNIAEEEKPGKHSFYSQPPGLLRVDSGESDVEDLSGNCYILNPNADNLENLPKDYYEEQVYGAQAEWVNVMIMNNYGMVRSGRPVYPEYVDAVHFNQKLIGPIQGVPIIIGVDLGLTPAAAFTQLVPGQGGINIFDELVTEDCSIRSFCEDILKPHLRNNYPKLSYELVIDPAAVIRSQNDKKAAAEIIKDCGLNFRLGKSNNQLRRKEAIVYFLGKRDGLNVGPKCNYIRKGFISDFKYEKRHTAQMIVTDDTVGLYKEKWEKNIYSHVHEALQYAALECTEGRTGKKRKSRSILNIFNRPADNTSGY